MSRDFELWKSSDVGRRLREFGEGCFERELERQRDSLTSTLEEIEWNRGVEGFKRSAKIPGQVRNDLEDLSRMFQVSTRFFLLRYWLIVQPVLPTTTYLSVMGYLVNVAITYVTDAILSQQDITEEESNHLNELLRTLHPLEELFLLEPGQVSFPSASQGTCADR
jgi:centromere/kinetochore protein ZW10